MNIQTTTLMKRVGAGAFLFFLAKGLLWLLIPLIVVGWRAIA